jgi:hypothetical protein
MNRLRRQSTFKDMMAEGRPKHSSDGLNSYQERYIYIIDTILSNSLNSHIDSSY